MSKIVVSLTGLGACALPLLLPLFADKLLGGKGGLLTLLTDEEPALLIEPGVFILFMLPGVF
jgi:hypothetical protein